MKQRDRITPEAREVGANMVRMVAPAIEKLIAVGEPDERCKSCAFREGTIPNGCPDSVMDALKCVLEGEPFYCHVEAGKTCWGWYAGRVALEGKTTKAFWPFSHESAAPPKQF